MSVVTTRARIAETLTEKHTLGIEKVVATDSWRVGITSREKKLERINISAEISRRIQDEAIAYARNKGIPYLPGINGIAWKLLRLKWLGYTDQINVVMRTVPAEWRDFLTQIMENTQMESMYSELRKVRV
ncbi:structural protein VP1 [Pyrobaculum filamentous virus 2]|uniref:Major capsid protein 1 n=1 Tax=Pyrobaculum filamentous virus 2 TaxID=2730621 RepID=CAPS1_PFV2|nr:structural protein VP1 [Pyrobaculum filamentous virus 2]A0A6M3VZT9.1 RecName: Full=Major capsid protein 1; AltName: Full=MCP1; AltName: Full=Major capsid protein VP1 [Pyrobaculum filamentous virus 2]6V7B_A Chain A, Structural protein VP1 [Pyrobaculum filamentous virus 1]6V7B_B Chain B, Structural protein VP1 [Pyrobaculum filamentous virus 1]6V7B_C Chain C, Structural protein VP1 [Pyrobaculum filamentous virus 1]6V7B_D Chain D, Structural protein VP1 [Pyrobaculum filamentous virus 1]6V7B_E 